ncbi:MAG: hypothetical protein KF797_13245, partial [Flavobacteriales bacterium]|nr:hypothetical protein [Flavobacteriales bacterium]
MAFRTVPVSFLCIAAWGTLQAQITVDPMAPLSLCGVANVNVGFTAGGTYNAGNAFTVELSDGSGSFAAPAAIGSVAGTGSGTIACAFPAGIVGGSGWAIRVVAS